MELYQRYLLPRLIHLGCSSNPIRHQRRKVIPIASGRVLDVGMGSGLNLPYFVAEKVEILYGLEPSEEMRQLARPQIEAAPFEVRLVDRTIEENGLEENSFDSVALTCSLCSIEDPQNALAEIFRLLKPGGKLLFSEHGLAPDEKTRKWQNRLNPIWIKIAGGCRLNRSIPQLIKNAGFELNTLEEMYLPSTPKFAGYTYWGTASAG